VTAVSRNSREDVIRTAGRLFAERGYHGTSMRDLGRELGLHGSSLYSHISSKEDLLVDVVARGADLFEGSARRALAAPGGAEIRLRELIAGHVAVVLDNLDVARTFLNEARALDESRRDAVVAARDRYEQAFRSVLEEGRRDGTFAPGTDPRIAAILVLSILNAIDRWYRPDGPLDRAGLVDRIVDFTLSGVGVA
jgi:TetR/AcrR family transcriptional regulator, cholesterol catabolism regulator